MHIPPNVTNNSMKPLLTFISAIFLGFEIHGQNYPQTLIDSLCNLTIIYYYTEYAKPLDSIEAINFKPKNQFILKSDITRNLQTVYDQFTVYFVTQQEALKEISKTKNKTGYLGKIFVTELQDTINIDIGGWGIKVTKVKFVKGKPKDIHANFAVSCGGTLGYIPTCRFIYNKSLNSWTRYTWTETVNEIIKKRNNDNENNNE